MFQVCQWLCMRLECQMSEQEWWIRKIVFVLLKAEGAQKMSLEVHCFRHFFFLDITRLFGNIFRLLAITLYSVAYIFRILTN